MSEDENNVMELVETSASYCGRLYNGIEQIVESLRRDEIKEGLTSFSEVIDGFEWLITALNTINSHLEESDAFNILTIKDFLAEIIESAENMDYVLLTDLLEYEILPIIDEWGLKLDSILKSNS